VNRERQWPWWAHSPSRPLARPAHSLQALGCRREFGSGSNGSRSLDGSGSLSLLESVSELGSVGAPPSFLRQLGFHGQGSSLTGHLATGRTLCEESGQATLVLLQALAELGREGRGGAFPEPMPFAVGVVIRREGMAAVILLQTLEVGLSSEGLG
jgi:hypothetical protein